MLVRASSAPPSPVPALDLWDLHQKTEAEWRVILATRPEEAVAWIRLASGKGFKAAQLVLGQMHLDGHGVPRDPAAAHGWFAKAAAIGSAEARNMVGRCHELGWGVPVDHAEALVHYRKAAAAGLGWAHYNIGCLLLYGTGVARNHGEAFASFTEAAGLGNAKALGMLGRCHEEGWGTPVDGHAARELYRRAAAGGDCWGALNLGLLRFEDGEQAEAAQHLRHAIALATPNCLATIVDTLGRRPEPILATVADEAARRADAMRAAMGALGEARPEPAPRDRIAMPGPAMASRPLSFALLLGAVLTKAIRRGRQGRHPGPSAS